MIRSSIFITVISLAGSFLGFLTQVFIAHRYGVGVTVDAYLFAISVPLFIASLVTGIMSHEFVPRIVALDPDRAYRARFITTLLFGCLGLTVLVATGGVLFAKLQLKMLPADSTTRTYESLTLLLSLSWIIAAFQILQGSIVAILNAYQKYLLGATLLLFPYIGTLSSLNLESYLGISALLFGMLFGVIAAILFGLYIIRRITPFRVDQWLWADTRKLLYGAPYAAVAMTCFSSYSVVDAYWSSFSSEGALASLGYAQRIIIGMGNLAAAGPIVVLAPRLAQLLANNDFVGFRLTLQRTLMIAGAMSVVTAAVLAFFSKDLVHLLFARGSFDYADVIAVSQTLKFMAPGMAAMLLSAICLRVLFCFEDGAKIASIFGLVWTCAYFGVSGIAYKYGAPGIALGYSVVWLIYFFVILRVIFDRTAGLK